MPPKSTRRKPTAHSDGREPEVGKEWAETLSRATSESTAKSPVREDEPLAVEVKTEVVSVDNTKKAAGKEEVKMEPIPVLDSVLTYPADVTVEVVERIDGIVGFSDDDVPRYGIGALPAQLKWGTCAPGRRKDIDCYMCTKNHAIALWLVGRVQFAQLGSGEDCHIVTMEPLSSEHLTSARDLQYKCASPTTDPPSNNFVYATRRNKLWVVFDEAYDATEHLLPWSRMQKDKIAADTIQTNDTVLVEAYVRRMKTDTSTKGRWSTWTVTIDLERVAVLARVPTPMELPCDSEVNL